jgi:cytochrome P450
MIDLLSPEVRADPFPTYRAMRERTPACQVQPGNLWALTRYADVARALHDTETFSSRGFKAALAPDWLGDDRLASFLIAIDPPEHTRMRGVVHRIFTRELLVRMEGRLHEFILHSVNRIENAAQVEVVSELATPIAAAAVALVLDLDPNDHRRFKHWVDVIGSMTPVEPEAARVAMIREAISDEDAYFRRIIEQRRQRPGNDVISMLLASEADGRQLETAEVVILLFVLLGAGIDTTIHLISKALLLLSGQPELLERLRNTRQLIPDFVEEMLRFDPPTHALPRLTTRDVVIEGTTIPSGSVVLLLLAAANRDPAQYDSPDAFILERQTRGSLAFGHGPHVCIGAALARLEARLTFEILLGQFRGFERDAQQPIVWDSTIHTRGPLSLDLRFLRR